MPQAPRAAVVMGSKSDLPVLEGMIGVFEHFGVPFEMKVLSAHRSPRAVEQFAQGARERGLQVIVAAAGGAAHLAGVIAANTTLPVIGIPIPTDRMGGMDSLLSTVQMPGGVPVATVGLGRSGAKNAAVLAVQILAVGDESLRKPLEEYKAGLAEHVEAQDAELQKWLEERG
jgi:phosphoribosylaminoimidazole carboxylase PurE protein